MTRSPGLLRLGLTLAVAVLAGACAFGLWHVVVGGLVNGNPRAATFGLVLATVTGIGLGVVGAMVQRARRD